MVATVQNCAKGVKTDAEPLKVPMVNSHLIDNYLNAPPLSGGPEVLSRIVAGVKDLKRAMLRAGSLPTGTNVER